MAYSPESLLSQLVQRAPANAFWVAYSGGLDSTVLLHSLARLRERLQVPVRALHVHHGLSPNADAWATHCRQQCEVWDVPLEILQVEVDARESGIEAGARDARYRAFAERLEPGACLLTGQHAEDRAETLLLRLLRGAGVRGMAAMPAERPLGQGTLLRPLLPFSRAQLADYARSAGLHWIEDESNRHDRFDRNYLRLEVWPRLIRRWPRAATVLSRAVEHAAEAQGLLDELAGLDLAAAKSPAGGLGLVTIRSLSHPRQRNLLRFWLATQGLQMPETVRLEEMRRQLLEAGGDANPRIEWQDRLLTRYRDRVYLLPRAAARPMSFDLEWSGTGALALPDGRCLRTRPVVGRGIKAAIWHSSGFRVRSRRGGERCEGGGGEVGKSFKHLCQEAGIPPWERGGIPLLYQAERLIAVGDFWVCALFRAAPGEAGVCLEVSPGADP